MGNESFSDIPDFLKPGSVYEIGQHTFKPEEIIEFATAFDPQPFHVDAEAAQRSLFGGLCASGWHTVSVWMKLQRASIASHVEQLKSENHAWPEFGPSPGMQELKWLSPVFAGETIVYSNRVLSLRKSRSKPDWWLKTTNAHAENKGGKPVMAFQSTVFVRFHKA